MKFNLCILWLLTCSTLAVSAEPQKYALLIGVTQYQHAQMNRSPLKFPEADAKAVGELLKASGYEVDLLLGEQATLEAAKAAIKRVEKKGNAEGIVFVGLFGHGVEYDNPGKLAESGAFFGVYNTGIRTVKDSQGRPILQRNGLPQLEPDPATMLSLRDILIAFSLSPAGRHVILADCCREDPSAARGRSTAFGSSLSLDQLPPNTSALFACSKNEQAFEHDDWGHGAFTKGFLDSVQKLQADGEVNNQLLAYHIGRTVKTIVPAKANGKKQTVNPLNVGDFNLLLATTLAKASTTPRMKITTKPPSTPQSPPPSARGDSFKNSIGMTLQLIPAGSFMMGSEESDDEKPVHRVQISKPFSMQTTEVTQGQWEAVMGTAPWKGEDYVKEGANYAATYVSWNDAVAFCEKLSQREGRTYRLPTEAEWEYACRAGTSTTFSFGDDESRLGDYAWWEGIFGVGNCQDEQYAHEVGQKRANPFGLYDLHGNVWEWCSDWYGEDYYAASPAADPQGPLSGSSRVLRGGSWDNEPHFIRSAVRGFDSPDSVTSI